MIIKRRKIKAVTFRVSKDMRNAVGEDVLEIVFGDVVVHIPQAYDTEKVIKALEAIGSLLWEATLVEAEEKEGEIKKVLNDY
jgi:hypothetical protein